MQACTRCNSNDYEIFRQDGSFNWIDASSCIGFQKLKCYSHTNAENEVRAIVSRLEINTLLNVLIHREKLSNLTVNYRHECSLEMPIFF